MLTFITGGARSGKSRHALELAEPFEHRVFIATAQAFDDEMRLRIDAHRLERGAAYQTIEAPLEPGRALDALPPETEVVVLDCLTLWLGNLIYRAEQAGDVPTAEPSAYAPIRDLLARLDAGLNPELIVVSNELGMGLVPAQPMSRAFRDLAGRLNQDIARRADRAILMVSGLPMSIPVPDRGRR